MNELQLQRELIQTTIAAGGWGFKANNRFLIGVADVHLLLRPMFPTWIEVKYRPHMPRGGTAPIDLTPHQKRFIANVNRNGGMAGWLVVVKVDRDYVCAVGRDLTFEAVGSWPIELHRGYGRPWPIREILLAISGKAPVPC